MVELFASRLGTSSIGIPDLMRVLRNEGNDARAVARALEEAMAQHPAFASRNDKLQKWIEEAGWPV